MGRQKITPDHLDYVEIDEHGRLFWRGEPIVTDARLALSKRQNLIAAIVGVAAVLGGLGSFVQGLVVFIQYVNSSGLP